VTLVDANGVDLLAGGGANLSGTVSTQVVVAARRPTASGSSGTRARRSAGCRSSGCESGAPHTALELGGYASSADATRSTAGVAAIVLNAALFDGATGITAITADANLVAIRSNGATKFLFDADGDSHEDGTGWTAYDDDDDVALIEAVEFALTSANGNPIDRAFSTWMVNQREQLERAKLVAYDRDGGMFVNRSRMQNLLCGAVRQLASQLVQTRARLDAAGL
jgi:hypothetical protein